MIYLEEKNLNFQKLKTTKISTNIKVHKSTYIHTTKYNTAINIRIVFLKRNVYI